MLLAAPFRLLADPKVAAPLLFGLIYYPEKLLSLAPKFLHPILTSPSFIRALKVVLALRAVSKINDKLSQWVLNNWTGNAKFIKSQEIVFITGGSSGIGNLMALDFAKKGVKVVIFDLNPPKEALPSNVFFYQGDVTSSSSIASAASEIRKVHGDPTVIINNAGIGSAKTILDSSEEVIRKIFEVNTISHFLIVKEFLPAMIKKNHGHVVTIASMASFLVIPQNVDYSATKASALAFHEGLASELKYRYSAPKVKTTVVHPIWIDTPLIENLTRHPSFKSILLKQEEVSTPIVDQVLAGRSGQIILPSSHSIARGIRGWPKWLEEGLRNKEADTLKVVQHYSSASG
ncbi:hypothetical protein B7494_g1388 [Chlorociboria aeruginascens]|nr:hypothetical protein B7494_g1388 [Chlorociboria aeruginascens]